MISVRPFLNHDPPAIARLINECCNLEAEVSTNLLEFAVFAKTYFERDRFFVATIADQVQGFVHLGSKTTDNNETGTLTIANYLVRESNLAVARTLLEHLAVFGKELGFQRLRIGTEPDRAEYYNGISTHFLNVGIPKTHPILPVLEELGFRTIDSWQCLEFDVNNKQVPFTREQMSLRRTHILNQKSDPDLNSLTLNAIYSHLATSRLELNDLKTGQTEAALTYACLSHSYPNWPAGGVDVIGFSASNAFDASHFEFLLCEILRQLPQTGLSPLRIHIAANDTQSLNTAEKIGFERVITSAHVEYTL
ncbi:MAG: hypothetical protein CMJ76_09190 [Planctomycetaceae bacterium]|nr:hypothetical protein [Planctomycetaceae bacterium]